MVDNTLSVSTEETELWGIDLSIIVYGVVADVLLLIPFLLYLVLDDTNAWAQYHQTYINMLFSAYSPLAISWFIVLADDSQAARTALTGAIEMAGLGPFALLWVGFATFMMSAKSGSALVAANVGVWIFALLYPVMNIGLIVLHYHLSPAMYAWLALAPMAANPIDNAKPWNLPKPKEAVVVAEVVVEPVAEVSVEPARENADLDFEEGDDEFENTEDDTTI